MGMNMTLHHYSSDLKHLNPAGLFLCTAQTVGEGQAAARPMNTALIFHMLLS